MTKQEAISIFNGTGNLARAISVTTQAIRQWPDEGDLSKRVEPRIIAAIVARRNELSRIIDSHGSD